MRVLEIGPWDRPVECYFGDPSLNEYIGLDMGVWSGGFGLPNASNLINPVENAARLKFNAALARMNRPFPQERVHFRFGQLSLDMIPSLGQFNIVYAANVFGDPRAIIKDQKGLPQSSQTLYSFISSIKRLIEPNGRLEVLEVYTPFGRRHLSSALQSVGLREDSVVDDLPTVSNKIRELYPTPKVHEDLTPRLEKTHIRMECERHGVPVEDPYFAVLRA